MTDLCHLKYDQRILGVLCVSMIFRKYSSCSGFLRDSMTIISTQKRYFISWSRLSLLTIPLDTSHRGDSGKK